MLEKDFDGLDRLLAVGARIEVAARSKGKVVQKFSIRRAEYMSYVAKGLGEHTLLSYDLPIDRVLLSTPSEWRVECHSMATAAAPAPERANREVVTIGIANGHAVVTALYLEEEHV